MKTVLFIPGFKEYIRTRNYQKVLDTISNRGYEVKFVQIDWNYKIVDDWVKQLGGIYSSYNPDNTIISGFSYGAVTSLLVAAERNPAELWLCSLSSYFKEDFHRVPKPWLNYIGKRRAENFQEISFNKIAPKIKCKTLLFIGEQEINKWPIMGDRTKQAARLIKNGRMIVAPGAAHQIEHPGYIKSIQENI